MSVVYHVLSCFVLFCQVQFYYVLNNYAVLCDSFFVCVVLLLVVLLCVVLLCAVLFCVFLLDVAMVCVFVIFVLLLCLVFFYYMLLVSYLS